jgi:hypothetical protein
MSKELVKAIELVVSPHGMFVFCKTLTERVQHLHCSDLNAPGPSPRPHDTRTEVNCEVHFPRSCATERLAVASWRMCRLAGTVNFSDKSASYDDAENIDDDHAIS